MYKILILSPHLDDAALSCADHILSWQKNPNITIHISTIFNRFSLNKKTLAFQIQRKSEDLHAMKLLKINFDYYNFDDAITRKVLGRRLYTAESEIFTCNLNPLDEITLSQLIKKMTLRNINSYNLILIPLGIGRHVDHLLVKIAAKKTVEKSKLCYYADMPYLLKSENWHLFDLVKLINPYLSVSKKTSELKLKIIKKYTSQYRQLFMKNPSYREILIGKKLREIKTKY